MNDKLKSTTIKKLVDVDLHEKLDTALNTGRLEEVKWRSTSREHVWSRDKLWALDRAWWKMDTALNNGRLEI